MKRIILYCMTLVAIMNTACSSDKIENISVDNENLVVKANLPNDAITRAVFSDNGTQGKVLWNDNDFISISNGKRSAPFLGTVSQPSETALFAGKLMVTNGDNLYAFYPKSGSIFSYGTFYCDTTRVNYALMYGTTKYDGSVPVFQFHNAMALLKVKVSGMASDVTKITNLKVSADDLVTVGKFDSSTGAWTAMSNPGASGLTNVISIQNEWDVTSGNATLYIPIIPQTLKPLSIYLTTSGTTSAIKTYVVNTTNSATVEKSVIYPITKTASVFSETTISGLNTDNWIVNGKNEFTVAAVKSALDDVASTSSTRRINVTFNDLETFPIKAFFKCTALAGITAPKATSVGSYAFQGCSALTKFSAPGVTTIGAYAFQDCSALSDFSAEKTTTIEMGGLQNCTSLSSVSFPNVTTLGAFAFRNTGITSISLPLLTSMGTDVFNICTKLKSVSLPLMTSIPLRTFQGCTTLGTVSLPVATSIDGYAFSGCTSLTTISLSATTLGLFVFQKCTSLSSVSLPNVTTVGNYAFTDCSGLKNISLPSLTGITNYMFQNCKVLTSAIFALVTTIGDNSFRNCSSLTTLTFGSVITKVGSKILYGVTTTNTNLTLNAGQGNVGTYVTKAGTSGTFGNYTFASVTLK